MLNSFQQICAKNYGGGDFAHVESSTETHEMGDMLFAFLMIELSAAEGCDGSEEAVRRLEMAVSDVQGVIDAIDRASGC